MGPWKDRLQLASKGGGHTYEGPRSREEESGQPQRTCAWRAPGHRAVGGVPLGQGGPSDCGGQGPGGKRWGQRGSGG